MTTYIGLLRAVNLGPTNKVAMAILRTLLSELGLADVKSLLQVGHAAQEAASSAAKLEEYFGAAPTRERFGLAHQLFVPPRDWRFSRTIAANPFPLGRRARSWSPRRAVP